MRAIATAALVLVLGATPAMAGPNGAIDLFNVPVPAFNAWGTPDVGSCQCQVAVHFGVIQQFAIAIYARTSGASAGGFGSLEYYINGLERTNSTPAGLDQLPSIFAITFTPAPGLTVLNPSWTPHTQGTDINRRGNMFWEVDNPDDPDCQRAALVFIGRLEMTANAPSPTVPANHYVSVVSPAPPSGSWTTAVLLGCDNPFFTPVSVTGGQFIVNASGTIQASCTVAVNENTWGGVKSLYR